MEVTLGDLNYPIAESIIFFILILSLIFNTFLFHRGQGNYSIKYQLMRNQLFFRQNMVFTYIIEYIYKFFFVLPFLLLVALTVLAALRDAKNIPSILINGLIILLILYPTKTLHFYYKMFTIWLLVIGSQLSTLFIYQQFGQQSYYILSTIFYTANILFFYLSLVSIENVYWQVSDGFNENIKQLTQINSEWVSNYVIQNTQDQSNTDNKQGVKQKLQQQSRKAFDMVNDFVVNQSGQKYIQEGKRIKNKIPKIFDGGLYGFLTKNKKYKYIQYLILYLISLIFLGIYAYLVHKMLGSQLGIVGLISAIIYDIFIKIFNSLENQGRSLKSVYVVLVISRLFSFVFGIQNWLLGYCVLYFGVSIFIGWIIIEKRFPMRQPQNKRREKKVQNALKTPQFVLVVLTVQIIIMIVVQAYALQTKDPTLQYNNVTIPIWQWGVLAVIGAWVINIYLVSVRVLSRHRYKIFELTQYYFGISRITQYHIFVSTSYLLLIGIGLYALLYLQQKLVIVCCIFLPLIYLCMLEVRVSWSKNQYKILADTDEYNARKMKKKEIQSKKKQKLKNKKKANEFMKNTKLMKSQKDMVNATTIKNILQITKKPNDQIKEQQDSMINLNSKISIHKISNINSIVQQTNKKNQFVQLRNWRSEQVKCTQIWSCLTPQDKKIIFSTILFILLTIGFCLMSMLWAQSKFAISFMVCIFSYLTLYSYVKYYKTKQDITPFQIIISWAGFLLGITYWAVFNVEVVGPIAYSVCYITLSMYCLVKCYKLSIVPIIIASIAIQIVICIVFIEIILSVHRTLVEAVVFGVIFFILIVFQVPLYFKLAKDYIPKLVIGLSLGSVGAVVCTIAILGYVFHIISSFAIFSIILFLIFLAFFVTALVLYLQKQKHKQQNPNIYSAYGDPQYLFNSAKQVMVFNMQHYIIFSFSMITIVVFSVIVSVFFIQKQWAVFGLSIFWLMQSFINLQAAMSNYIFIGEYRKKGQLTKQIVIESFKKLNDHYMNEEVKGQPSSYYKQKFDEEKKKAIESNNAQDWEQVVKYHDLYVKNIKQQERFLFFWVGLIMFNLVSKERQHIIETLAQLKQIQDQLGQFGIILQSLNLPLKPKQKYRKVMKQIQSLEPVQFILYQQTLAQNNIQNQTKKIQSQQMHKKQKQQNDKREQQLFDKIQKDEVVKQQDQIANFNNLIKSIGKKRYYQDKQFPADNTILGDQLQSLVSSWRRPGVDEMFSKQGISAGDVKQGQIGDCYLLSSFAVLGEARIKQAIGYDSKSDSKIQEKKWKWKNQKGAFMIRFFKFSKQKYIIIDDLLPSNQNNEWVFAKSEDPIQYWPCILQKAYAKLYGGYNKIVEGKCHQVLSEFTNGFPTQILLQQYKSNPYGLWSRIISSQKNRHLLAAGSPSNPKGDSVSSKRGIVQGHAYSVLDAQQVDQYRLIKLKNPHGSEGKQWNGDFSDKSDLMTKVMMQKLGHQRTQDGIFWMTIEDFIIQFKSLYVCAVFDENWKKLGPFYNQWNDSNSFGLPNQINAQNNPHYGIKVTKKCTLFLSLTQQNLTALVGKNYIYIKTIRNNGKRINSSLINPQNTIGRPKKVTNAVTISEELQLQANEYPYTFSVMLCCKDPGNVGKFTLLAYCDDLNAQIIQDKNFDRKN